MMWYLLMGLLLMSLLPTHPLYHQTTDNSCQVAFGTSAGVARVRPDASSHTIQFTGGEWHTALGWSPDGHTLLTATSGAASFAAGRTEVRAAYQGQGAHTLLVLPPSMVVLSPSARWLAAMGDEVSGDALRITIYDMTTRTLHTTHSLSWPHDQVGASRASISQPFWLDEEAQQVGVLWQEQRANEAVLYATVPGGIRDTGQRLSVADGMMLAHNTPVDFASGGLRALLTVTQRPGPEATSASSNLDLRLPTSMAAVWDVATAHVTVLPAPGALHAAWAPDGTQLAMVQQQGDDTHLAVLDAERHLVSAVHPLDIPTFVGALSWSPDGNRVAVLTTLYTLENSEPSYEQGNSVVVVTLTDSPPTTQMMLVGATILADRPSWRPQCAASQ